MDNRIVFDILDSVHTIIAGVTGSGKSVLLNDIIYTIIKNYSADDCRLILCDPKRIEFAKYKRLPHVLRYGNDTYSIISALRKAHDLMEQRYRIAESDPWEEPDFIPVYVIIDELADLLQAEDRQLRKEYTSVLYELVRKSRSANIHLIVATQSPQKSCFPSWVQNNFTMKVALRCDTPIQSQQILGQGYKGAEKLEGVGNALVKREGNNCLTYVSIPYIELSEIRKVVESIIEEHEERLNAPVQSCVPSPERSAPSAQQTMPHACEKAVFAVLDVLKCVALIPFCVVGKLLGKC